MYFSFYFEKCTFIDIKLKDLSGALVFGKHGLSLTNPPRPGFSSYLVLPPSDYSFRLGTSNNYKEYLLCDRLAPSVALAKSNQNYEKRCTTQNSSFPVVHLLLFISHRTIALQVFSLALSREEIT